MQTVLITGGSGFFGQILIAKLLEREYQCVNIDLVPSELNHPRLESYRGDIRNTDLLKEIFEKYQFRAIFHCAAILAHGHNNQELLWSSNVQGTRNIAEFARKYEVKNLVFTSSNCLWGHGFKQLVTEDEPPEPVEIYGKSKWEGEKILQEYRDHVNSVIIRCPTIIDYGRLGLLTILFEFIDEGRKVWLVGNGSNKYQFIYAGDLVDACIKGINHHQTDVFNIGSDYVRSFNTVYEYVIDQAQTGAEIAHFPNRIIKMGMKLAYILGLSPLGPYQYKMISENFVFDTRKIKESLNWSPTVTNEEMLYRAYRYYREHLEEIKNRKDVSAHRSAAKMGVIKLLKWIS